MIVPGQGAIGDAAPDFAVDLVAFGMIADGAAFIHSDGFRFSVFGKGIGGRLSGRGEGGQKRQKGCQRKEKTLKKI